MIHLMGIFLDFIFEHESHERNEALRMIGSTHYSLLTLR